MKLPLIQAELQRNQTIDNTYPRLVCLGNLTVDDVVMPDGQTFMERCGSDALYSAFGAAVWLKHVGIVAPRGMDFPERHLERVLDAGWSLDGFPLRDVPSIRNWILYENDGRRTFVLRSRPEDFLVLSPLPDDIPNTWLGAQGFHIAAMELEAQELLVKNLGARHAILSLDPCFEYLEGNTARLRTLVGQVDIFTPSHIEAEVLVNHKDHVQAAYEFAGWGCKIIVIKEGRDGSLVLDAANSKFYKVPAFATQVVDETGAGDAYCGGFIAEYLQTRDTQRAAVAGAVAASFAIESFEPFYLLQVNPLAAQARFDSHLQQSYT